jgi:flagellar protein FliS
MSQLTNPYQNYRKVTVETASPQQLVLMLYDEAIKQLRQSIRFIDGKQIEKTNKSLNKVQDILQELLLGVNSEAGNIAIQLQSLYDFMIYQIGVANTKKSKSHIEDVLNLLIDLRTTWNQVMKEVKS